MGDAGAGRAEKLMPEMENAWRALLELSEIRRRGGDSSPALAIGRSVIRVVGETWSAEPPLAPPLAAFLDLYMPFALARRGFVVGHLGQSLDGRIATAGGASRWVTGEEDVLHNHRMRALSDAVLVGAATLRCDDPQLTVRDCAGRHPVRVVLDPDRTLAADHRVFRDGAAPSLLLVAADTVGATDRLGDAEIVAFPRAERGIAPAAIVAALAHRGLRRLYVEGGGITVSRFLAAGCLDRLQITVSPLIIGSGRPSITLPEISDLRAGLRPRMRRFELGPDIMFESVFHE